MDTNVLYQALCNREGASFFILNLIRNQNLNMTVSTSTFKEYEAVLKRKSSLSNFKLNKTDMDSILGFIAYISKPCDPRYLFRPNLIDEDDNKFVELAFASGAEFLITSNIKDYKNSQLKFDSFEVITPSDFCKQWRKENE